jgi:hypothetical protein
MQQPPRYFLLKASRLKLYHYRRLYVGGENECEVSQRLRIPVPLKHSERMAKKDLNQIAASFFRGRIDL